MMSGKITSILFLLIVLLNSASGQNLSGLLEYDPDNLYTEYVSVKSIPLFNKEEIRLRKIKTCSVIEVRKNQNNRILTKDSLALFRFDDEGNNIGYYIRYNGWNRKYRIWDTIADPSMKNKERVDTLLTEIFRNNRTIRTLYHKFLFNPKSVTPDTGLIQQRVYDHKNRLISSKDSFTRKYMREFSCGDNPDFSSKYRYDHRNRIIYFWHSDPGDYSTIEYKRNQRIIKVYSDQTQKLTKVFRININKNSEQITQKGSENITLYRLERNSALFRLVTKEVQYDTRIASIDYVFEYQYEGCMDAILTFCKIRQPYMRF